MSQSILKALTVCQPYAWALMHEKRIENRCWTTRYRGLLAIHAGKSKEWLDDAYDDARWMNQFSVPVPAREDLVYGAFVGVVDLHSIYGLADGRELDPINACGPYCWYTANPRKLDDPVACSGRQTLWIPPLHIEDEICFQLGINTRDPVLDLLSNHQANGVASERSHTNSR